MQKLTNFFKYNNAFVIILGALFLVAGSSFASETVRDAVIGRTIEEVKGMDNSALLAADLDSLKQEIVIADVSEDEKSYSVSYSFSTFDIKDNAWQNQTKNQTLKVPKEALNGGKDLGLYVQNELSQIIDSHLAYLKEAQEKEQKKGETKAVKITKYTGLKGLVFNSETKELEGYEPVIKKEERKEPEYAAPTISFNPDLESSISPSEQGAESIPAIEENSIIIIENTGNDSSGDNIIIDASSDTVMVADSATIGEASGDTAGD